MIEEIKKIVEANLPAQTAGVMREYIEKAERALIQEKGLKEEIESKKKANLELRNEVSKLDKIVLQQTQIDAKLKDIASRELALDKAILEIKLAEAEKRADALNHLTETVFKNRTLTISKSGNIPVAVDGGGNGCCGTVMTSNTDSFETREEI
jgi:predicted RNase H-like nuclease (RuvC/YqgF family)